MVRRMPSRAGSAPVPGETGASSRRSGGAGWSAARAPSRCAANPERGRASTLSSRRPCARAPRLPSIRPTRSPCSSCSSALDEHPPAPRLSAGGELSWESTSLTRTGSPVRARHRPWGRPSSLRAAAPRLSSRVVPGRRVAAALELEVAGARRHPLAAAAARPAGPRVPQAIVVGTVTSSGCSNTWARISRVGGVVAGRVEPVADQARGLLALSRSGWATVVRRKRVAQPAPSASSSGRAGAGAVPSRGCRAARPERPAPEPGGRDGSRRSRRRPAFASSSAAQAPSELPAGGAARSPSSAQRSPTARAEVRRRRRDARRAARGVAEAGQVDRDHVALGGEPVEHRAQIRRDPPRPWIRTRGSPVPSRS